MACVCWVESVMHMHHLLQDVCYKTTLGALVSSQHMILHIQVHHVVHQEIQNTSNQIIDLNNYHQNLHHISHNYQIGDEALVYHDSHNSSELGPHAVGLFYISQVHANGTTTIQKNNYFEHINICRVHSYFCSQPAAALGGGE